MIAAYGIANLLQSVAATRTTLHHTFDPGLLLRLVGHRTYLVGLGCQMLGFVLAFLARRDLPLFLVQASVAAGLGVTALLGVLVLKWRLPAAEVLLLVLLLVGITALVLAARPAPSRDLGTAGVVGLVVALGVIGGLGFFAVRLHGSPGSVALGSLAGLAFSAAAVAARPLASVHSIDALPRDPLLYLLIAHSIVGQLLLGLAMQRGSTTAAVAAMDAAGAVPAAIVGLLLLGDRIWPGREWLAGVGFLVTLIAVLGLTRYAEPQHQHTLVPGQRGPDLPEFSRPRPATRSGRRVLPDRPAPGVRRSASVAPVPRR
jgi:drug/metabolite transporter (DMT)-like permease